MIKWSIIVAACLLIAAVGWLMSRRQTHAPVAAVVATQPATRPATQPAAKTKPKYPTYLELVRAQNPAIAATQPLDFPLELTDSAHLILHDPVYLDPIGNLWITRFDGRPTDKALQKPDETEDHIIQGRPVYVHWWTDDAGNWHAAAVVRVADGYDLITSKARNHLADDRPFHWDTAYSVLGKIVVTTQTGVSVFDVEPAIQEQYHTLPGCGPATNPPVTMLDSRGVLAWAPWEKGRSGSQGVSRFVDGNWTDLPAADWPARPIQLSMLLDGSILRLAAGTPPVGDVVPDAFPDQIHVSIGQLEAGQFDEKHVKDLIDQLSDPDGDKRQAVFDELSRYGPGIAPLLEKAVADQLPEAALRIQQLLRNKITPALGGMSPVDQRLDVVKRCADGTVIFFAPSGVQIPTEHDEPDLINPAWLALRPDGRMEHPLPPSMVGDQKPEACTLMSVRDEWINTNPAPARLVGNRFEPLLAPGEKPFTELVGIATHRRWMFRNSSGDTLIIDPLIADPTPRLPVWTIVTNKGVAGWDNADFPAVSRGGDHGDWELDTEQWKPLVPTEKVITHLPPATQPTSMSGRGKPVLTTADGTRYFDCKNSIDEVKRTGEEITWPLPSTAVGTTDPTLIQTPDGLLFVFNQSGRLLRIRPTPGAAEPFKIEAVFTKGIPNSDQPDRIWLDPAGRIVFLTEEDEGALPFQATQDKVYILTICFPTGVVPKEISRMMLDERP